MKAPYDTDTLTDHLAAQVKGRRVVAGLFTTFTFEPSFFELEILPALFDRKFSHVDRIRRVDLADELRRCGPLAVYYDRRGLLGGESARLDVRRIPMQRTGFFHPKVILLLLEEPGGDHATRALVVGVASANLTQAGWWRNLECAHFEEIATGAKSTLKEDLLGFLKAVRNDGGAVAANDHEALDLVRSFLKNKVGASGHATVDGLLKPRLFYGQQPLPRFLEEMLGPSRRGWSLEIVSPYLDAGGPRVVELLNRHLAPKETRVALPFTHTGKAACSKRYFQALPKLRSSKTSWAKLPKDASQTSAEADDHRTVHAKIYRLFHDRTRREVIVAGSANLTEPGHSQTAEGNLEAALVFERKLQYPRFWLERLGSVPAEFDPDAAREGSDARDALLPVSLRFDWEREIAEYFWDGEDDEAPARLLFSAKGVTFPDVSPVRAGRWVPLPKDATTRLADALTTSSFVDVAVDEGGPSTPVLVTEVGMVNKPSLLAEFTAADILRYWSLLTDDQREAFLRSKLDAPRYPPPRAPPEKTSEPSEPPRGAPASFFDGFAAIFHAFSSLERRVSAALVEKDEATAKYLVFGRQHDSLPQLLARVLDEPAADPIPPYLTMGSARKMVATLERTHPAFFERHPHGRKRLRRLLAGGDRLRAAVVAVLDEDAERFLSWFERRFSETAIGAVS